MIVGPRDDLGASSWTERHLESYVLEATAYLARRVPQNPSSPLPANLSTERGDAACCADCGTGQHEQPVRTQAISEKKVVSARLDKEAHTMLQRYAAFI